MTIQNMQTLTDDMVTLFNEAFYLINSASLEKNEENYLRRLETEPEYYDTFDFRAKDKNDYKRALQYINQILQTNPQHLLTLEIRAATNFKFWDTDAVIDDLNRIIELAPTHIRAYLERASIQDIFLNNPQKAFDDYSEVLKIDPNNIDAYNLRASIKINLNDHQGAIDDYTKAIEIQPDDKISYTNRGSLRIQLNDIQGGFDDFEKAIQLSPDDPDIFYSRGSVKMYLKDFTGAYDDFSLAIQLKPDKIYYKRRAKVCKELLDYPGAIQDYTKVLELDPDDDFTYEERGLIKEDTGDFLGAIKDYTIANDLCSDNHRLFRCASLKEKLNDYQGAIEDYTSIIDSLDYYDVDHILRTFPQYATVFYQRAQLLKASGDENGYAEDMKQYEAHKNLKYEDSES